MAKKENKGGELTNEQIEKDLKAKGASGDQKWYKGAQDTGDQKLRSLGTQVQKDDGLPNEEANMRNSSKPDR
jgi:hypothetical protein